MSRVDQIVSKVFLSMLVVALFGCDGKRDGAAKVEETKETTSVAEAKAEEVKTQEAQQPVVTVSYAELPADAVLASVGGTSFTKGECEENVATLRDLLVKKNPRLKIEGRLERVEAQMRKNALTRFVITAVIMAAAKDKGVESSKEIRSKMEVQYARVFGKRKDDYAKMVARLAPSQRTTISHMLEAEVAVESYLQAVHSAELSVTDADVSNQVAQTVRYNAAMVLTNATTLAQASNVLARVRSGEDFGKLADELSQDPEKEQGGDIGFKSSGDYCGDDAAYWRAVSMLKPGEITDVMTTSEGYEIVKFAGETKVDKDEAEDFRHQRRLARILWRRAMIFNDDPVFIRRELMKDRRNEVIEKVFGELSEKFPVTYPHGKNIIR